MKPTPYFHRPLLTLGLLGLLLSITTPLPAAVMNYAAQLRTILISQSGNNLFYRVFDPALGRFVEEREGLPLQTSVVEKDGIVTWQSGSILYARFYDPALRRWMKTEVASFAPTLLQIRDGVLAWTDGRLVNLLVYDLSRHAWKLHQDAGVGSAGLQTAHGTATWYASTATFIRTYDPILGRWVATDEANQSAVENLLTRQGITAWSSRGVVYLRTYEPAPTTNAARWIARKVESGSALDLQIDAGVVTWQNGTRVYFQAYDPVINAWRGAEVPSGPASGLALRNGSVSWIGPDLALYIRGYDVSKTNWISGLTVPYASFGASAASGTLPTTIYFFDRSLGAAGWGWRFGDGQSRFEQSPHHTYTNSSLMAAQLTVHGPHGVTSSALLGLDFTDGGGSGGSLGSHAPLAQAEEYHLLEAKRNDDGRLEVIISGLPGQEITLESSTDLATWEVLADLTLNLNTVIYVDATSAGVERRFYRARGNMPPAL